MTDALVEVEAISLRPLRKKEELLDVSYSSPPHFESDSRPTSRRDPQHRKHVHERIPTNERFLLKPKDFDLGN
jgi:hypothetical protein